MGLTHNNPGKHSRNPDEAEARAGPPPQPPRPQPASDIPDPFLHPAVLEYQRVMEPDPGLSIRQAELIAADVPDDPASMAVWKQVLKIFAGNEHRGRDGTGRYVGNALDRFGKEIEKLPPEALQRARAAPRGPAETRDQKEARLRRQWEEQQHGKPVHR